MATIRKLPSGKWNVQVRKKGHKPATKSFRTKAAAESWAREAETNMEKGTFVNLATAERTTVEWLLGEYKKKITPRKKSKVKEESRLKILTEHLGQISLAALSPEIIISFVDDRLEDVVSDTIRKELNTLSHAIDTGMALWGIHLPANPVVTARRILSVTGTLKPGVERDRRLKRGELRRLLKASLKPHRALWIWALESAMRRGEIAAMLQEHRTENALRIPETKTGRPRTIHMTRHMRRAWKALPFGMKPDSISQALERACAKAKIENLRFHDFRHEATSRLFEKGLAIQEVAAITGHTDWKSLKRYTHPGHEQIAEKLGG